MIKCILPWPPSVNSYYRKVGNKMLISERGRKYRVEVKKICYALRINKKLSGDLKLYARCYPPDHRRRDIDNLSKAILDSLEKGGVYSDDNQIKFLFLKTEKVMKNGAIEVEIAQEDEGFDIQVKYF